MLLEESNLIRQVSCSRKATFGEGRLRLAQAQTTLNGMKTLDLSKD